MAKLEEGMEVCESCEVHENLLKIVNEKMPEETELYDLAELFKVFGDSTRMRILFVLFEAEVCVCAEEKENPCSIHWQTIMCVRS